MKVGLWEGRALWLWVCDAGPGLWSWNVNLSSQLQNKTQYGGNGPACLVNQMVGRLMGLCPPHHVYFISFLFSPRLFRPSHSVSSWTVDSSRKSLVLRWGLHLGVTPSPMEDVTF